MAVVGKRTQNGAGTSDPLSPRSLACTRPSRAALQNHVCPPDVFLTATFFRGEVTTKSSKLHIKTMRVRGQRHLETEGEGRRASGVNPAGRHEKTPLICLDLVSQDVLLVWMKLRRRGANISSSTHTYVHKYKCTARQDARTHSDRQRLPHSALSWSA